MTDVQPIPGFCYICNHTIDGDLGEHVMNDHPSAARKIRAAKISWEHRLANCLVALEKVAVESDRGAQIDQLDEVLQELYLVRARLAQMKGSPVMKVEEGS